MKWNTIKSLVEEEKKAMYAAVVLADDIFPFELSERERTCVFLVEPERDHYAVSCDGRIFEVEQLMPDEYEDMFLIGFTLVPATRDTPKNFQFFTSISDAVDELFAFIFCDANEVEHTEYERYWGRELCKAQIAEGTHTYETSWSHELLHVDVDLHTDYYDKKYPCERQNTYWYKNTYCPTAGVHGHYNSVDDEDYPVEYFVAECHMHSLCNIDVIETSQGGLFDDELANFGNILKKGAN